QLCYPKLPATEHLLPDRSRSARGAQGLYRTLLLRHRGRARLHVHEQTRGNVRLPLLTGGGVRNVLVQRAQTASRKPRTFRRAAESGTGLSAVSAFSAMCFGSVVSVSTHVTA